MILDELNPRQREAAERTEGALVVLAGAGSGKTKTLTARAANIVDSLDVWPGNILCITFTNKAAREMKERIHAAVGPGAESMWIHTFHGMCVRILRSHGDALGYTRDFTIYDTSDSLRLIKRCLGALDMDEKYFPPKTMLDFISRAKNHYEKPAEFFRETEDYVRRRAYDVYALYEKEQRDANAMDFDNLLLKTIELLEKHEDVRLYYGNKFRYVMVDEYQDTNPAQYKLIRLLCSVHGNICVVGDDDQSIYGWRGADIRNILEFEQDFPGAATIRLEQNYRSYGNILNAANTVISHNLQRKGKNLFTDKGEGYPIVVYRAANEKGEADYVVNEVDNLAAEYRYEDMAILYRINAQSRAVEEALMRSGIHYRVYGGMKFYDRREVKDIVSLLRFLQNPRDDLSLFSIINVPKRGIGDAAIAAVQEAADRYGVPAYEIVGEADQHFTQKRMVKNLLSFRDLAENLFSLTEKREPYELILDAIDQSGMLSQYLDDGSDEALSRAENIKEFVQAAKEYFENNPEADLAEFLQGLALVMDTDEEGGYDSSVTLMTLHSAKGLEFPVVFLIGMEEGLCPHSRSLVDDSQVEEERRLCYVGITRAMERLYLSYCVARNMFNNTVFNEPSRFLAELPEEGIIRRGIGQNRNSWYEEDAPEPRRPVPVRPQVFQKRAAAKAPAGSFAPGDKVVHPLFKQGTVITEKDGVLEIAFPGAGVKKIDTKFAVVKKV